MAAQANTASLVTNLNVDPYYDDFDESKNFHRILFRPGMAVQARELTQVQSILQNQVDRMAEFTFKEGSSVRGMELNYDRSNHYIKLRDNASDGTTSANVYPFADKIVKGTTSGVLAKVIKVNDGAEANTPNFKTLFVKYLAGNTSTGFKEFANNEILTAVTNTAITANSIASSAAGKGSSIKIGAGVIFAKDHFIRVDEQDIILDKYNGKFSGRVGYNIEEEIVDSIGDTSLTDPASGSYNYSAPGANRLKITAVLTKKNLTEVTSNNFIQFAEYRSGELQSKADVPQLARIRDYMAKRTYDESGDYIVKGLLPRVREHLLSGNNQGVLLRGSGGVGDGNNELFMTCVEPGKAYVQGYDVELYSTQKVPTEKGIDTVEVNDSSIFIDYGNYLTVDNVCGQWDVHNHGRVSLRDTEHFSAANGTFSTVDFSGASIGTARVRDLQFISGIPGSARAQYRLYLTDIKMTTAGKGFNNVKSVAFNAGTGNANGKADILGVTGFSANTSDSAFNRAVFNLPAKAIKTLRDSAGAVDVNHQIKKEFDFSFGTNGQATITSSDSSETFIGSGTLSDAVGRENFYIVSRETANTTTLTGTITKNSSSNTITGSGTAFTSQLNVGDVISCDTNDTFVVGVITSDTALSLEGPGSVYTAAANGAFHKRIMKGQVLDMGGFGKDGSRTISIGSTTQTTFDIQETLSSAMDATAIVTLAKADTQEATKAVIRNRLVQLKIGAGSLPAHNTHITSTQTFNLGLSDGFNLVSVRRKASSAFSATSQGSDVTSHFTLDSGMRDNFYDHAKLKKKTSSSLTFTANDHLLVTLDHFTHSNRGRGYFSMESYPVDDATAASDTSKIYTYEIPIHTSPVTGQPFDLRNAVDFRPRITDTATSTATIGSASINPATGTAFDEPSGGLRFPPSGSTYTTDFSYYIPRKDVITLTKGGGVSTVRGVSSLTPRTPLVSTDAMSLGIIEVAPYPSLPDEIARRNNRPDYANKVTTIKNERFTMRDIGVVRDRVQRLEYYTSLTLLEKEAKDLNIKDSSGLDRFKNGFLVDGFTGHGVGNVYDEDYKIAVDPAKREGRPPFKLDNIEMFYNAANSSNIVRTNVTTAGVSRDQTVTVNGGTFSNGETLTSGSSTAYLRWQVGNKLYIENATGNFAAAATITGGTSSVANVIASVVATTPGRQMMLPYEHDMVMQQKYATTTRNTAGLSYKWKGYITLTPRDDYWVDTVTQPEVQVNIDGNADAWQNLADAWGTQWGDWETVATGAPVPVGPPVTTISSVSVEGSSIVSDTTQTQEYVTTSTAQQVGTSIGISLSENVQSFGNVIRDTNIQPFMRSREIRFKAEAMKPSTRIYGFFDQEGISDYITPTDSSYANTANEGAALNTDTTGTAYGIFRLPNNDQMRFRVGEKIFRLTDNVTNDDKIGSFTTCADTTYAAQGLTATSGELTVGTTTAELSTATVINTQTNQQSSHTTTPGGQVSTSLPPPPPRPPSIAEILAQIPQASGDGDGDGNDGSDDGDDPLAQTFIVDTLSLGRVASSGAFITKVDLFFSTKDDTLPLIIEIREVDPQSGYPTEFCVPHGKKIVPAADINTSTDGTAPTPIYFNTPLYIQNGKQYSILVKPGGSNPNVNAWIARLGDEDIKTGERVTHQPISGMLFASSNDKTYQAMPTEDLKMNVYFADFNAPSPSTASVGTITLKNEDSDFFSVANLSAAFIRAGEEIHGETYLKARFANTQALFVSNGSTYVQGATSGASGILTYYSTANNDARVKNVTTGAKFAGGEFVRLRLQSASGTIVGNSTGGLHSATYPLGKQSYYNNKGSNTYMNLANTTFANSGPAAGNNRMFVSDRWIYGQANSTSARIVSLDSLKADLINFKTDYVEPSNTGVTFTGKFAKSTGVRDTSFIKLNVNTDTEFDARRFVHSKSAEGNTSLTSANMKDGSAEIKVTVMSNNRYASPVLDVSRISMTTVENLINSNSDIGSSEDNVGRGGDAKTRYITRRVTLAEGQDAEDIKVYYDGYVPQGSAIQPYYKVLHAEDSDLFEEAKWIPMTQTTANTVASSSENRQDFREFEWDVPSYGDFNNGLFANSNPASILQYRNGENAMFSGFKYYAIKLVMMGTDTQNVPRVRNLRAIALQK